MRCSDTVTPATLEAVFVSDLHLGSEETTRHRAVVRYLTRLRSSEDPPTLYILGDLFNYWAGRASETAHGHRVVLEALREAAVAGVDVRVMRGNRDFLLDGRVGSRYRFSILPDSIRLRLGSYNVFACHGDSLLLNDRAHMRFRWILQSFWLRGLADLLPRSVAGVIARRLRRRTVRLTEKKMSRLFEVPPEEAGRLYRGGYDVIICGHVHHARRRTMTVDGREHLFFSLGAWDDEASVLEFDGEEFRLTSFPIEEEEELKS